MNPSTIDLTTLDAVKLFAVVPEDQSSDDILLQSLITSCSRFALNFCGRDSLSGASSYSEIYDGNGSLRLFPRNAPILSISSLQIDGVTVQPSAGYGSAGYFIERAKESIAVRAGSTGTSTQDFYPSVGAPYYFRKGLGNILLVYSAGYLTTAINEQQVITAATITLANPNWFSDLGISFYPSLVPLVLVPSAPAAGQYAVSNGLYVFAAADEGKTIVLNYKYGTIPEDVEYAVKSTVVTYYKRKDYRNHASTSASAGGSSSGSTTFRDWKFAPEVTAILQNYRRVAMGS